MGNLLVFAILFVVIIAIIFYLTKGGAEEQHQETVNQDKAETTESEVQSSGYTTDHATAKVSQSESERIQQLLNKAEQVETFRMVIGVLMVISCGINIWAAVKILPGDLCTAVVISFIIMTVLTIYTVNIWSTTKQELCKGQAEILKKLEKKM